MSMGFDETERAEQALIAYGAARTTTEMMRVCRDYRDALLSDSAQGLVLARADIRRATGDAHGAAQLEETYRGLRERLQSSEFMEMVDHVLAREQKR